MRALFYGLVVLIVAYASLVFAQEQQPRSGQPSVVAGSGPIDLRGGGTVSSSVTSRSAAGGASNNIVVMPSTGGQYPQGGGVVSGGRVMQPREPYYPQSYTPPSLPVDDEGGEAMDGEPYEGEAGVSDGSYAGEGSEPEYPMPPVMQASCGDFTHLIGKNIKDIDISAIKNRSRVIYPDSPVTMDFSPDRVNIILEKGTDIIIEVRCG